MGLSEALESLAVDFASFSGKPFYNSFSQCDCSMEAFPVN